MLFILIKIQAFDKLIFYHIPKTGGTTITYLLNQMFKKDRICWDDFYYQLELRENADLDAFDFFRGHFFYSTKLKNLEAFRFCFLREPVSRIISEQRYYLKHYTKGDLCLKNLAKEHAFEIGNPIEIISNNQMMWLSSYHRDDPKITDEMHFESAKKNLRKMDFIGLFEDFENSAMSLYNHLGFELPQEIPHLQTVDTFYDVSNEVIEEIKKRNYYDILFYDFAKELYHTKFKKF